MFFLSRFSGAVDTRVVVCVVRQAVQVSERGLRHQDVSVGSGEAKAHEQCRGQYSVPFAGHKSASLWIDHKALGPENNDTDKTTAQPETLL